MLVQNLSLGAEVYAEYDDVEYGQSYERAFDLAIGRFVTSALEA